MEGKKDIYAFERLNMENIESGWEQLNVFDDLFKLYSSPVIITSAKLRENEVLILSEKESKEYTSYILNLEQKELRLVDGDFFKDRQMTIFVGQKFIATGA